MVKKKAIVVAIPILLIIMVIGTFIFEEQNSKSPLKVFNDAGVYQPYYGYVEVTKEIGVVMLDDSTCLFLGEFGNDCFVVDEQTVKNGKYSQKGITRFYEMSVFSPEDISIEQTQTHDGFSSWSIFLAEGNIDEMLDSTMISRVETFEHSNGQNIYVVIYK
ncbi:MAG: hypothetical protein IKL62_06110 [Clostridia bacterium]|nr:hypothetical protein [Clostridia bacterium]